MVKQNKNRRIFINESINGITLGKYSAGYNVIVEGIDFELLTFSPIEILYEYQRIYIITDTKQTSTKMEEFFHINKFEKNIDADYVISPHSDDILQMSPFLESDAAKCILDTLRIIDQPRYKADTNLKIDLTSYITPSGLLDTSVIPYGSYCYNNLENKSCPYRHLSPNRDHQECGYCAFGDIKDWEEQGFSLVWDAVKECSMKDYGDYYEEYSD